MAPLMEEWLIENKDDLFPYRVFMSHGGGESSIPPSLLEEIVIKYTQTCTPVIIHLKRIRQPLSSFYFGHFSAISRKISVQSTNSEQKCVNLQVSNVRKNLGTGALILGKCIVSVAKSNILESTFVTENALQKFYLDYF